MIFNENLGRIAKQYLRKGSSAMSKASCKRANGPTRTAMTATPPKSCCSVSAANWPCWAGAVIAAGVAAGGGGSNWGDDRGGGGSGFGGGSGGGGVRSPTPSGAFDSDLDDDVPF